MLADAARIWPWVCLFLAADGIFCVLGGVLRALGLQLRMGLAVLASLWLVGLPTLYFVAVAKGGGLLGLWWTMAPIYVLLNGESSRPGCTRAGGRQHLLPPRRTWCALPPNLVSYM
eukprot:SAG22_NODE_1479_length_4327_cov_1.368496_7_plen_116_part_00